MLFMEFPGKNEKTKKTKRVGNASQNEFTDQFSKSLMANVLDINDDFIGNKCNPYATSGRNQAHIRTNASLRSNYANSQNYMNYSQTPDQQLYSYSPFSGRSNLIRENSGLLHGGGNYEVVATAGTGGTAASDAGLFSSMNKSDISSVKRSLGGILKEIKQITQKIKDDEEDEQKELNWKFAAMVIDRLCLVIFATCTLVSTVSILMTSKNFFSSSDPHPVF
jgi:hypothetical protein